ncbi:SLC13 family permease [Roseospira marina]|uniref:SLC13 family permease n=1 Tax=Roseospira marina TaxID=140057 RepID=A0A5M6I7L0_9PROT|nr:SLC13 family permease [Roseospira marina]KAA5604254.1 SLC13 family permease [Roseospira marina]MBB4315599.1 di/tricarboxylate transporter [Roseospira marina]MBB5088595.1 di/tricarboxylate transporter [Roseospira marina]
MTHDQILIIGLLLATLVALALHRWRYDVVAVAALLTGVALGLVPMEGAFTGLSNPAVVTVAAILVLGRTMVATGTLDPFAERVGRFRTGPVSLVAVLCGTTAAASTLMNNVGALALMMPVALAVAARRGLPPSLVLMPVSFAALLGGMTTLIGTPPNMLIAQIRAETVGAPFSLLSFAPVAVPVALVGVAWLSLAGWRLVPQRRPVAGRAPFEVGRYQCELTVAPGPLAGQGLHAVETAAGLTIHGVLREGAWVFARREAIRLEAGDVLCAEADLATIERLTGAGAVTLGAVRGGGEGTGDGDDAFVLLEAVVPPGAVVLGSALASLEAADRWGIAVVAVARNGRRYEGRLEDLTLAVGDVLLLHGPRALIEQAVDDLACLPLAARGIALERRRPRVTLALFGVGLLVAAAGVVPAEIAFTGAILAMVLAGVLPVRDVYRRVDWSVIVLLAALVPLSEALAETGAARALAETALGLAHGAGPTALLAMTFAFTALVTPVLNNVATVLVLAPVVVSLATQAGLPVDPFLIAVAIGASADFLTPFGHHNNTIIMGPGGYRFGDYWRPGLPLLVLTGLVAVPLLARMLPPGGPGVPGG